MKLEPKHLEKEIYSGTSGTLANRIDYAWDVYQQNYRYDPKNGENAFKFLMYAFDIQDIKNANSILRDLMADRKKHSKTNPDYIPLKSPEFLPFDPQKINIETAEINVEKFYKIPKIRKALLKKELLLVNDESKNKDEEINTPYLNKNERSEYNVDIRNGVFMKNNKLFSTEDMKSHGKKGYGAYTLNINGELSLFNHNETAGDFLHSSMNAGVPVIAAGELKITNGKLEAITTHSGHYTPTLFNVYRVSRLSHLK